MVIGSLHKWGAYNGCVVTVVNTKNSAIDALGDQFDLVIYQIASQYSVISSEYSMVVPPTHFLPYSLHNIRTSMEKRQKPA